MALIDTEGNHFTALEDKEEMARRAAFLHPPGNSVGPSPPLRIEMVYECVDREEVQGALDDQAPTKAP